MIVGAVVIAAVCFYGGYAYAGTKTSARGMVRAGLYSSNATSTRSMRGGNAFSGGATVGKILSKDSNSLTVELAAGGSRIVFLGATTPVMKTVAGTVADLQVGTNVMIGGMQNPDGSLTAQSIQIRPVGFATTTRSQ